MDLKTFIGLMLPNKKKQPCSDRKWVQRFRELELMYCSPWRPRSEVSQPLVRGPVPVHRSFGTGLLRHSKKKYLNFY